MSDTLKLDFLSFVLTTQNALKLTNGSPAHDPGLVLTAALLRFTTDAELIKGLIRALLPEDYKGDLMQEVPRMIEDGIRRGFHETSPLAGGNDKKQSETILEAVEASRMRLFKNALGEPYMAIPGKTRGSEAHPLRSGAIRSFIQHAYYQKEGKPPASQAVREALDHLEAQARFDSPTEEVHIRVAGHDDQVILDLGDATNRAIVVRASGWELVEEPHVNFVRPNGTVGAMPVPEHGFEAEVLRQALNMSMPNFILFVAFLISALNPKGPYFLLQIHGEQGSGKSNIGKLAKDMIDPNRADKLRLPKSEQDLVLHAQAHWVLNYDNASYVNNELSDFLCTVATGGAFSTRKLYTDGDMVTYVFKRPVILNGIGNYATRPDLQERSIPLNLTTIAPGKRKTEREMETELAPLRPKLLGFLLDCVVHALANLDEVEPPRTVRMADAAHWLVAAEGATGFPEGAILDALEQVQNELLTQTTADDGLTTAILTLLLYREGHSFEGRYGHLHELITPEKAWSANWLPRTPSALSSKLSRMAPGLRRVGVEIEPGARTSGGQTVILRLNEEGAALAREIEAGRESGADDHDPDF